MQRVSQDQVGGAFFDDRAEVHHGNAIADLPHHAQIMADEDHRHAALLLQVGKKIDHLRLDRHIER